MSSNFSQESAKAPFRKSPVQSNLGTTAPKHRAVDVSGSKVSLPPAPAAVGIVCSSLPAQRATINGLKGARICLT